ncbi:MAG: M23 family metallopeptidase [Macromonas sp.]
MNTLLQELARLFQHYPKRLMGGLGVLLLGTGVTAFGVAPLSPTASNTPVVVQNFVEPVQPALQTPQHSPEASTPFVLFQSDVTRRDDTLHSLLRRLGVNDSTATAFLRQDAHARQLLQGTTRKLVTAETNDQGGLVRLTARWLPDERAQHYNRLVVEHHPALGWRSHTEQAPLTRSTRLSSGTIRSSLFAATDAARLPDDIATQLADLFSANIDFRRDLQPGDRFSVVYETLEADGEVLQFGRLLAAEFINQGQAHQKLWFEEPGQKGAYYSPDGKSNRNAFLASPLEFSRMSSGYGLRFHPISGNLKAHLGVDYAAPTGTPVRSVAEGTVTFAGWKNGYGNVIEMEHSEHKSTVYAHLSRIHVRTGQRVAQSDTIGLVGSTGVSTGPHLHFEYKVSGQHQDPLNIARDGGGQAMSVAARQEFEQVAQAMRQQLDTAATVVQANAE